MLSDWISREPIVLPRWVLQLKYLMFVLLAGLTAARGLVSLELTSPDWYRVVWSSAIMLGAIVAFFGSLHPKHERTEKWAAVWIASWLSFVALASLFTIRGSGFVFILMVTLLPAGRAWDLARRHARRRQRQNGDAL